VYLLAERLPDERDEIRNTQLRQWSAEAAALLTGHTHWDIVRLCRAPEFRPESRWIAERIGSTTDEVNVVFARLLRLRLLDTDANGWWRAPVALNENEFRCLALARVRERRSHAESRSPVPNRLQES
jgi:hypothetical protein